MEAWVTETLEWVEQSKASREAELEAYAQRMTEIRERNEDQTIRLDLVSQRLTKIRGQLDNLQEDLANYEASKMV